MKKVIRLTESDLTKLVKRIIVEMEDQEEEDFFYKSHPSQKYYYDKEDRMADFEDDEEFDVEEWDEEDFEKFHEKYPYGKRQKTFPHDEPGKRWFKGYAKEFGGKFPVFKRKRK